MIWRLLAHVDWPVFGIAFLLPRSKVPHDRTFLAISRAGCLCVPTLRRFGHRQKLNWPAGRLQFEPEPPYRFLQASVYAILVRQLDIE